MVGGEGQFIKTADVIIHQQRRPPAKVIKMIQINERSLRLSPSPSPFTWSTTILHDNDNKQIMSLHQLTMASSVMTSALFIHTDTIIMTGPSRHCHQTTAPHTCDADSFYDPSVELNYNNRKGEKKTNKTKKEATEKPPTDATGPNTHTHTHQHTGN